MFELAVDETRTHQCPFCAQAYKPRYPSKEMAFMTSDMEAREQYISGCCSDACWDAIFPPEVDEPECDLEGYNGLARAKKAIEDEDDDFDLPF